MENGNIPSWAYWIGGGFAIMLIKFTKDMIARVESSETQANREFRAGMQADMKDHGNRLRSVENDVAAIKVMVNRR